MIKNVNEFRKRIQLEFKKYRFDPSKILKSYYESDKELASIQRLLFEWNYYKGMVKNIAKEYKELSDGK